MDTSKDFDENLNIFKKCVQDIVNYDVTISETYKAIILLNYIPHTYKNVKNAIKYDGDSLTPKILIDPLSSKEMEIRDRK